MRTITISRDFRITIPKAIRKKMHLAPGDRISILQYDNRLELIFPRQVKSMRGSLKGMNTEIERE